MSKAKTHVAEQVLTYLLTKHESLNELTIRRKVAELGIPARSLQAAKASLGIIEEDGRWSLPKGRDEG